MGEKVGEKEKFSFWHFCGEKSEKVTKLRSGYAAGLPGCPDGRLLVVGC